MQSLIIPTQNNEQVIDITGLLNDLLMKNFYDTGLCFLFAHHSSCALAISNMDPGTEPDLLSAYTNLLPKIQYKNEHDSQHIPDHVLSTLIGVSLTIPVQSATMELGSWQRVVLLEFNGPKNRRITVNFLPIK